MLRNYIIIAFRNIWRNKMFSMINMFGLSIGMASCILITMWVQSEISYDTFHEKSDRIFRVERKGEWQGKHYHTAVTAPLYGKSLVNDFPEVINSVRIMPYDFYIKDFRNESHKETLLFADKSIFQVFTFPLLKGNSQSALSDPNTVVITEDISRKYFKDKDPMGKLLSVKMKGKSVDFKVTGIMKKMPGNSHLHFDLMTSFKTYEALTGKKHVEQWHANYVHTYILLEKNTHVTELSKKMPGFIKKYPGQAFAANLGNLDITKVLQLELKPLTDIHLKSNVTAEIEPNGSQTLVVVFSLIAFVVLLTACINFMNLSTVRSGKRSKEIGMRKVSGAGKKQLVFQFLGESILMALAAMILAVVLVELALPFFNELTGKTHHWIDFFTVETIIYLTIIVLFTGFFAGIYPALFLTRVNISHILKGEGVLTKGTSRRILVLLQFAVSISLIISACVIYQQQTYFNNKPLGFEKEQILVVDMAPGSVSREAAEHYEAFRNSLTENNHIINVSASSKVPSSYEYSTSMYNLEGKLTQEGSLLHYFYADYDYLDTYGMELAAGRNFSRNFSEDDLHSVIINEAAAKQFGFNNPVDAVGNTVLTTRLTDKNSKTPLKLKIVGVVRDYNFMSLHHTISPLIVHFSNKAVSFVSVKTSSNTMKNAVELVKKEWGEHFSGIQLNVSFMDDSLNQLYEKEQKTQTLIISFTCLGIVISCLGLFGLAAFSAELKRKEMGIRKILGASAFRLVFKFSGEFAKWVLLANIIAWPVSWYFMNKWLENFAYRISLSLWIFILAGAVAMAIAVTTVCLQAVKAASANPVDSLKYE